ncbi:MAG: hypothetical protein K2O73_02220, partial [Lachnospiraceae bacterium]|nr:hypothetical protein [Lachnospiraceae bacterium]
LLPGGVLNGIGANPYTQTKGREKTEKSGGDFLKKMMKCVNAGGQKVSLGSDALMSYASPQTGESVNIYNAESYGTCRKKSGNENRYHWFAPEADTVLDERTGEGIIPLPAFLYLFSY